MYGFVLDQPLTFLLIGIVLPIVAFFLRKRWKSMSRALVVIGLASLIAVVSVWGHFGLGMMRLTYLVAEDPEEQNVVLQLAQEKLVEKFGPEELLARPFYARLSGGLWTVRGTAPANGGRAAGIVTLKKGSHEIVSIEHE